MILSRTTRLASLDRNFCGTMGHVMAVSAATIDPSRVGGNLESAHAVLAGLDPAHEIGFALAMGKLMTVHLNDQNGMLVNMNDVLRPAKKSGYGVGFFNAVNVEMARAVIEAAEELRAPVMVGTAEVLLPVTELDKVADYLIPMAKEASVPVCVHYDHGLTFERCMQALKLGFTSVMYDCSTAAYEDNINNVAEMVKICHGMGVTVEGELGHVGDNEGAGKLEKPSDYYTDPGQAKDFAERTGIDSLAVAVGNAHGDYKFPPKLDFERIRVISEETGLPLVLHGGSGLADDDFKKKL